MKFSVVLSGKGGQGIHTLGKIIRAAILESNPLLYTALAVDYDTAVKGGISNCHLIVSGGQCNPVVEGKPDIGIDICDSSATISARETSCEEKFSIPSRENEHIRENTRGYVLLGMLVARGHIQLSKDAVIEAITLECKTSRICLINQRAFEKGLGL